MNRYPVYITSREARNDFGHRKTELAVITNDGRMYVGVFDYLDPDTIRPHDSPKIKWVRIPDLPQQ